MARRREVRKNGACYESCYVYICVFGDKYTKLCDASCFETGKPCRNYINAYWKISRFRHYIKRKPEYPTTLDAWKKRVKF